MVRSAQHRLVVRYHPWLVSLGLWLACTAGLRQALGLSPASLLRSRAVSNSAESAAANQLLLLKSEIELLLNASPATGESVDAQFLQAEICSKEKGAAQWVEEVVSEQKVCGKEAVEQVVQEAQRLLLQLDRSDGRPDLSAPVLANRFYALAATCLRTKVTYSIVTYIHRIPTASSALVWVSFFFRMYSSVKWFAIRGLHGLLLLVL